MPPAHRRHLRGQGLFARRKGRGSVHHVAFRAVDDADQAEMARKLVETHGQRPTEQKDRNYFRSSISANPAASFRDRHRHSRFAVDEPVESLGDI